MAVSSQQGVVTPEAVLLRFETAGVPSRALAKALDVAIGTAFVLALFAAVVVVSDRLGETGAAVVALVGSSIALFLYPAVAEVRYGRTIGKAAAGLRVVTVEGGPLRARHATIRSALQVVDLLLVPIGVVAVLSALASPTDQRFGDRVAGTLVLRSRTGADDARALAFPPLPGYEAYVAALDVTAVTAEQYEVLRSFLTRVTMLAPDARLHLAERLAGPLSRAMGHAVPAGLHPELFCACVAAAYQRRHGGPQWA
jgi:uncharacterized RDD family membrane protein YckC